eukprot:Ihof_evm5s115 gene=Ihof_evmTU5s115
MLKNAKSDRVQDALKDQLNQIVGLEENMTCADCPSKYPRWASYSLGIFLCMACAGLHRQLGVHVTKIKSISLDDWTSENVETMRQIGNRRSNAKYEAGLPKNYVKRDQADFIRRKYDRKDWYRADGVRDRSSYSSATQSEQSTETSSSREPSYSREPSLPQNISSNRNTGERYSHQLGQLHTMGFTAEAANKAALEKAKGDVTEALEILISNPSAMDGPPSSAKPKSNNHEQNEFDAKMEQLKAMGFTDEVQVRMAIRQGGDIHKAVEFLVKMGSSKQPERAPASQSHTDGGDFWNSNYNQSSSTNAPIPQGQQTKAPTIDDLFAIPAEPTTATEPSASNMPASETTDNYPNMSNQINNKDIMDLFNSPIPSRQGGDMGGMYMQQQQLPTGYAGVGNYGGPAMMQQQGYPGGFNGGMAPQMGGYSGGMNYQTGYQQQGYQQQQQYGQQPTYQQQPYGQQAAYSGVNPFGNNN